MAGLILATFIILVFCVLILYAVNVLESTMYTSNSK